MIMAKLDLYLLRYGEIGTKSPRVRSHFEDILMQNIERIFLSKSEEVITEKRGRGRIFAYTKKENSYLFSRVFGLVSYSLAEEVSSDLKDIGEKGKIFADQISGTFAVRARRVGEHDYNSQDVEREIGSVILKEDPDLTVDLEDPEHEFHVEIRHSNAYVFTKICKGPGGLPLSSQGKVAAYVESKNDFVATWLMMKRGTRPYVYHPGSKWIKKLARWDPNLKEREVKNFEEFLSLGFPKEVKALVLGETLEDHSKIEMKNVVLRPLIGLDEKRIQTILDRIEKLEKDQIAPTSRNDLISCSV